MKKQLKYLHINQYKRASGFGILEFFISFFFGAIIILLMWQILLLMQKSWNISNEKLQLQQKAQIAFNIIATDLINSSYIKCSNNIAYANAIQTNVEQLKWMTYFHAGIFGIANNSTELKNIDSKAKSDAIAVFFLNADEEATVTNSKNGFLDTQDNHKYRYQDLLAIIDRDWQQITLFAAGAGSNTNKIQISMNPTALLQNCTVNFKGSFTCDNNLEKASTLNMDGATILRQSGYLYYIRYSNDVPNLYRKKIGLTKSKRSYSPESMVEGVEQLSIWYRYRDPDTQNSGYFRAEELGDDTNKWQNVNAVSIEIVVRSRNEMEDKPQDYFFANSLHNPKDKYIRRIYSKTIAIKNKI